MNTSSAQCCISCTETKGSSIFSLAVTDDKGQTSFYTHYQFDLLNSTMFRALVCILWGRKNICKPKLVFINDLAQGKRLVQNWSFCESTLKSVFYYFYKCYSQRMSVFGGFVKKIDLFGKELILLKSKIEPILFYFFPMILWFCWKPKLSQTE